MWAERLHQECFWYLVIRPVSALQNKAISSTALILEGHYEVATLRNISHVFLIATATVGNKLSAFSNIRFESSLVLSQTKSMSDEIVSMRSPRGGIGVSQNTSDTIY